MTSGYTDDARYSLLRTAGVLVETRGYLAGADDLLATAEERYGITTMSLIEAQTALAESGSAPQGELHPIIAMAVETGDQIRALLLGAAGRAHRRGHGAGRVLRRAPQLNATPTSTHWTDPCHEPPCRRQPRRLRYARGQRSPGHVRP